MIQEQLFINGVEVPLSRSLNPSFNRSIVDIKEPEKRRATYSKSTTLPNSKEAAKVLGHIFNINVDNNTFDPRQKADVLYICGGTTVIGGYMQLKDIIKTNNNDIEYTIVLFDEFASLFKEIQGLDLNEVTGLDTYDHLLTFDIQNHSSGNFGYSYKIIEGGSLVDAELGKGYIYALVDYGYSSDGKTFKVDQIGLSIYVKEYWDRIWSDAGFTYEFLDPDFEDHFKHLIIPSSPENFLLDSDEIEQRIFGANTPEFTSTGTSTSNNLSKGSFSADDTIIFANEVYDVGGVYNNATGEFTCTAYGYYDFNAIIDVFARFKPSDLVSSISSVGYIDFRASVQYYNAATLTTSTIEEYEFRIKRTDYQIGNRSTNPTPVYDTLDPTYDDPNYFLDFPILGDIYREYDPPNRILLTVSEKLMSPSDKIWITWSANYVTEYPNYFFDGATYTGGNADITINVGSFVNEVANLSALETNTVKIEKSIPNIKQTDFVLNFIKEYNLYLEADPDKKKHYLIAPRDSFYRSDVNVLDGSDGTTPKISIDKGIVYKPVGALEAERYLYKHKDDSDYLNEKYLSAWQETYGQREITVTNDFSEKTRKTEANSSPTPLADQGNGNNRVLPTIIQVDDEGQKVSTKSNWRVLYYGGLKSNFQNWTHSSIVFGNQSQSYYPYAGHFDDPFNPTLDINFGLVREVYYDSVLEPITVTDNNLYNKYHSKFLREITDKDSKIVEAWVHMTPLDFKRWSFRDLYYFDNAYFRLNEIKGFNPTSQDLTKCEFLKLKEVSPFKPTLVGLDGDDSPFEPQTDDGGSGSGGVILTEYRPTVNRSRSNKQDSNNYNSASTVVQGENNVVSRNAYEVNIIGDENIVYSGARGIEIINSDSNIIKSGIEDVTLINTNGLTIDESNVTYINGELVKGFVAETKTADFSVDTNVSLYYLDGSTSGIQASLNGEDVDVIFKCTDSTNRVYIFSAALTIDNTISELDLNKNESVRLRWDATDGTYYIIN